MAGEVDGVSYPFDPVNRSVCAVNRALDEMLLMSFAQFYIAVVPKNTDCRWQQRGAKFERSSIFGRFWIDDRFVRCFNGPVLMFLLLEPSNFRDGLGTVVHGLIEPERSGAGGCVRTYPGLG